MYDETPEKLVNHDYLRIYRGSEFAFRNPAAQGISDSKIYIQPVLNAEGNAYFKETKEYLSLLMSSDDVRSFDVNGVETLEVNAVYNKFMQMELGIYAETVKMQLLMGSMWYCVLGMKPM